MDRVRTITGLVVKYGIGGLLIAVVGYQVWSDVQTHGLRGLFGPIEALALLYGVTRGITWLTRGTPNWLRWRKVNNAVMQAIISVCAFVGCCILILVLVYVTIRGFRAINGNFFTQLPKSPDDPTGGMKNGIFGTVELVAIAGIIGIPIGLLGGIFLAEFGKSRIGGVVRFAADVLNGIPSVVIGMFAYAVFVLPVRHFSALAGGGALGVMMIPTIMRTTEEMLRLVPNQLREGSLGLGATRLRTIYSIVLPAASAGIITGILLAVARIAGETAPLLFTAFGNSQLSTSLGEPISSMTMEIYNAYRYTGMPAEARAWAGALVLLLMVLGISLLARVATRRRYALR